MLGIKKKQLNADFVLHAKGNIVQKTSENNILSNDSLVKFEINFRNFSAVNIALTDMELRLAGYRFQSKCSLSLSLLSYFFHSKFQNTFFALVDEEKLSSFVINYAIRKRRNDTTYVVNSTLFVTNEWLEILAKKIEDLNDGAIHIVAKINESDLIHYLEKVRNKNKTQEEYDMNFDVPFSSWMIVW